MSGPDNRPGAQTGQDNVAKKTEGVMVSSRMRLGVVSGRDLQAMLQVSPHTVNLWVEKGLKPFKPGTKDRLFLLSEVREFLERRETFSGKRGPRKSKK